MSLLHYTLKRRGQLITDEVICHAHYTEQQQEGRGMAELSDRDVKAGYVQTATPYTGDRLCETCEQERERHSHDTLMNRDGRV